MSRKYFGTDGIRGEVGQFPITPDFVLKLGWAAGCVFAREGRSKILIGKDTRISGYMFESALEAGLSAAGVDVLLTGPMPTPAIAYLTRTFRANAGIVISASHNVYSDNGIKFFSADGTKLPDEVERAIEAQMDLAMTTVPSAELGKARRIEDAAGRYIEFCKGTLHNRFSLKGMRIVLDCANGATYHVAPKVLSELGAEVIEIASSPDGVNINDACGATDPARLQKVVLAEKADLGVALDGDGDRIMMVDHCGEVVDGDEILFIIATALQQQGEFEGGVVGTLMSNFGLEQALKRKNIPFVRANVGDRYVIEQLHQRGWVLGGESSGHIVCGHLTTTGDGLVAALQVLKAMVDAQQDLNTLKSGMQKMPQTMINVAMPFKQDPMLHDEVQAAVQAVESELGQRGRVLLRPSGTEPVVRVMVEGEDAAEVKRLCTGLALSVEKTLQALVS
ncbi:phosphoglucosamine mutase [Marinobacterium sediminicola]|uniref:Phosphoglucosamine mutase n=1 Tax=Marinobacterium sediminicola TaxID=518898 RepID=A0ABY1S3M1_9GAMM|nr:phosphoglucosamine mutase [Marinobacterium sediminicola]ULG68916.1 phosphoglucosamine mutase [Marinobacterium sediminicola]SMR77882.1 phosphoglucosamine mutase [Marinobacterium sediminicola]